jgi:crotonobetainyl-CoA:carnitine CoA-transferase CaiB-like acyl-CoA transferase
MSSTHPLQGITVVEIGHTMAAPYAGMILAELGADVIKVESPDGGDYSRGMPPFRDGKSAVYQALNRGKRSVVVDLSDPSQALRLRALMLDKVDVVIHNLKFGAMGKLGFGATQLLEAKPSLIYCNIGAFGAVGPMRNRPGYDPLIQAFGGLMSIMGEDGRPPVRVGVSITDMATGLWSVIGIQAACLERQRTGRGGVVDTSLVETALGWLAYHFSSYFATGTVPKREGSGLAQIVPYQAFATADDYIMVAAGNDNLFRKLCIALERPDLANDPRFITNKDRVQYRGTLIQVLEGIFETAPSTAWLTRLSAQDVPCSPINTIDQVLEEPQTKALGMFQQSPDRTETLLGLPLSFDGVRPPFRKGAPELGAHTDEVFKVPAYTASAKHTGNDC